MDSRFNNELLCSTSPWALALACVASAAMGAAAVAAAVALTAGEKRTKSSVGEHKAKTLLAPLTNTTTAKTKLTSAHAVAAAAPCCSSEHKENAPPPGASSSSVKGDPFDTRPRSSYLSWDDYFMALAFLSAQRSKDPNKQVGAVIVGPDRIILGIGYNGFPRGCADSRLPWAKKAASGGALATKYPYVCHAEMNAVLNKNAASVSGATLFVTMFPCHECSKLLIQAGIGEVVFYEDKQGAVNADGAAAHAVGAEENNDGRRPSSPGEAPISSGGILPCESYAASRTLLALAGVRTRQHAPGEALVLRVSPLAEEGGGKGGGGKGGKKKWSGILARAS